MIQHLAFNASLQDYDEAAARLQAAHAAEDAAALALIHRKHPGFLRSDVPWIPLSLTAEQIRATPFTIDDARMVLARLHDFRDWAAVEHYVRNLDVAFEQAIEYVIDGDEAGLRALLQQQPDLVQRRSQRITHFDPPVHGAQLIHYVAANGVEGFRQRTPKNATSILHLLLDGGADPNSLAALYGGQCTTLSLLVSSNHPAEAGVQLELTEVLLDGGATMEPQGTGSWTSALQTALVFGYIDVARLLQRRGCAMDLIAAAGLGDAAQTKQLLPAASPEQRHAALALSAQLGQEATLRLLLEAGEDPNRFNPNGFHHHASPLHHAALNGHAGAVAVLLEHGARRDLRDLHWSTTPAHWARHGGFPALGRQIEGEAAE
jgi:ankyrin repeat protein